MREEPPVVVEPEQAEVAPEPVASAPLPAPAPVTREVSLRNPDAVRAALWASVVGVTLCLLLPLPPMYTMLRLLLALGVAGFLAVALYNRRVHGFATLRAGARLGWLTGLFCFGMVALLVALSLAALSSDNTILDVYREQITASGADDETTEQAVRLLQNPSGIFTLLAAMLVVMFGFCTLVPTLGGLLGAKVLEREEPS